MADLDRDVLTEQHAWSAPATVDFYRTHRNRPDDLYRSERFFLPAALQDAVHVLDVGCAAGGFSAIMRAFNPRLHYTGVDVVPDFVDHARNAYPDCRFEVSDGIDLPFPPGSFDLVHCSGVLHLNSKFREMVRSMWRMTSRGLLCDFRLTTGPTVAGEMIMDALPCHQAATVLPYHVLNGDEALALLRSLDPAPASVRGKGYLHDVATAARLPIDRVIMAFFFLEKGSAPIPRVEIDFNA